MQHKKYDFYSFRVTCLDMHNVLSGVKCNDPIFLKENISLFHLLEEA